MAMSRAKARRLKLEEEERKLKAQSDARGFAREKQAEREIAALDTDTIVDPMTNDEADIEKPDGDFGVEQFNQVAGAVGGAVSSVLGVVATGKDIESANNALMTNLKSGAESLRWSAGIRAQQAKDLAAAASDDMTAIGYEQMIEESMAKVMGAETGSSGSSVNDAARQSSINELHRKASVQSDFETSQRSLALQGVAERLSFENMQESLLSQQLDPMNAAMKVAASGLSSYASGQKLFG